MTTDLYRKVAEVLVRNGYELMRHCDGSHRIWQAPDKPRVTITRNILDKNLARSVLRRVGIRADL